MKGAKKFNLRFLKFVVIVIVYSVFNSTVSFAANITPIRTDVTGFGTWTDATITGTTYLQLLSSASTTITPSMDFSSYTAQTLDFKARTYGGVNASNNIITVSISTNNGSSWTVLGTRTPTSTTLTAQTQFDLSAYSSSTIKIKFETLGASGTVGAGIDDLTIAGTASCTSPTTQATSFSTNTVTSSSMNVAFTRGNGTGGVLIVAKSGSSVNTDPTSGTSYTANSTFGSGSQIGTGNYVVYNGAAASVSTASGNISVSGLSASTTYYFAIYEYNTTSTCYNLAELTGNQTTTSASPSSDTDYFRSLGTGNWNIAGTWQSSPDNTTWQTSTLVPTSSAASVTIQTGHIVTINADASASSVTIAGTGTLTFDGVAARAFTVTGDITISASGGSFITQSSGTYTNTMSIAGNISNAGTFDMSRGGSTLVCSVTFNKNGNQSVSGSGSTTRFSYVTVNMGTSNTNVLEISSSNFQTCANFLHISSTAANQLLNGTIKFSGSYTYSNTLLQAGTYYEIVATAGIWLNNSNVTTTAVNDSYDLRGLLRVTQGTLNVGTSIGNSIRYFTGSVITIEGGAVNIAGRLYCNSVGQTTTCTISGGTITLCIQGSNSASSKFAGFQMSATSTFVWSGGTIVLQQGQSYYGGMDYSDASTHATITGGTLQIANTNSVGGISEFYLYTVNSIPNLTITTTNSPTVYLFSNTTISGNISIAANAILDVQADPNAYAYEVSNPGTTVYVATTTYNLYVKGNWVNNGTFTARDKTVTFSGIASQDLSGTVTTVFNNLTMNNTSLTGLTFSKDAAVAGTLTLTDGIIYTSNPNYLTMNAGSTSTSGSTASFVDGPMKKIGSTAFVFPLGDGTRWRRIAISSLTGSETFTAQYVNATYSNTSTMKPETDPLTWVSTTEYWTLTRAAAIDAVVELYWEDATASSLPTCSDLRIAHWDNTNNYWEKANIDAVTTTGSCTGTNTGTIYSNADLVEFSPFTFGSVTIVTLPISLTDFEATLNGRKVDITWTTLTEQNNDFFTIEKTKNGIDFELVTTVDGAGNFMGELNYQTVDLNPYSGISYYRLTQTDFDGHSESFPMKTINLESTENFSVFPNPSSMGSIINVNTVGVKNDLVTISILDLLGNIITSDYSILTQKNEMISVALPSNLSVGVYLLVFSNDGIIYNEKMVVR